MSHEYENEYSFEAHFYFTDAIVPHVSLVNPYFLSF
jgi:hypothetical protein